MPCFCCLMFAMCNVTALWSIVLVSFFVLPIPCPLPPSLPTRPISTNGSTFFTGVLSSYARTSTPSSTHWRAARTSGASAARYRYLLHLLHLRRMHCPPTLQPHGKRGHLHEGSPLHPLANLVRRRPWPPEKARLIGGWVALYWELKLTTGLAGSCLFLRALPPGDVERALPVCSVLLPSICACTLCPQYSQAPCISSPFLPSSCSSFFLAGPKSTAIPSAAVAGQSQSTQQPPQRQQQQQQTAQRTSPATALREDVTTVGALWRRVHEMGRALLDKEEAATENKAWEQFQVAGARARRVRGGCGV